MSSIKSFLNHLKKYPNSSSVYNPYLRTSIAKNLEHYLQAMMNLKGKRVLLVGEAPGYKGCRITGIPFTSGRIFQDLQHPFLNGLSKKLLFEWIESENTASIVWNYLVDTPRIPLFWNSFPFHPHREKQPLTNRAPNKAEIEYGSRVLQMLFKLYRPDIVAGIGHNGVKGSKAAFPELTIEYIRHPSYGGKVDFIAGMNKIL